MKKFACVFLTITMSFILLGCSNIGQSELKPSITVTPIIVFESSSTPTVPTRTPRPTITLYPTSTITLTPTHVQIPRSTFEADKATTQTPFPPNQCPPDAVGVSLPDLDTLNQSQEIFEKTLVDVLNSGGIKEIISGLSESNLFTITRADLTHDNVPELIIENRYSFQSRYLSVFGCNEGEYRKLLTVDAIYNYAPSVMQTKDMNLNGAPDLALVLTTCHWCTGVMVYEWDGQEFQSLVRRWLLDPSRNEIGFTTIAELDGYADAEIIDTDRNGTYEVVLKGGVPSGLGDMYLSGPYRSRYITYMWDGSYYSFYRQKYSPPEYRFQAIQDGDNAALFGNYDEALAFYQDAIFNDQLKGWSDEEKENLMAQGSVLYTTSPTPTPLPNHNEDYQQLAAYARYRIMLLHVLNGFQSDAQTVYESLQEKFPVGNKGYPYAEMAREFWLEYVNSQDVELACHKAVEYADMHREILIPLGGPEYGFWTRSYLPDDICPFTGQ